MLGPREGSEAGAVSPLKLSVIVYSIAAVAAIGWGLFLVAFWYMDLFYTQPWFKELTGVQQSAARSFFDFQLARAVWPLVVVNAAGVVLLWLAMRARRGDKA
jgi:hypothetical protein